MKPLFRILLSLCCVLNVVSVQAKSLANFCTSQLFASELDAVRAAADRYNPQSIREDREYMGAIIEVEGRFGYTVSAASPRNDSWRLAIPGDEWDRVRAFWHTHGDASAAHRYFSDADTASVNRFSMPFYLADYTGYLKIFRPGDRTLSPFAASRLNLPRQPGFAIGEYIRDKRDRTIRVSTRDESRREVQRG